MALARRNLSKRSRFRDAKRSARDLDALILARELEDLSLRFPRFSTSINSLSYRVRFQVRSAKEKQRLITRALKSFDLLGLDEITTETGLDRPAVIEALAPMIKARAIELCLRDGSPYRAPSNGRQIDPLGRPIDTVNRTNNGGRALYFRLTSMSED